MIKIGKNEWPFRVTPGLKKYVKKAHVNLEHVAKKSKNETRRLAFYTAKAAAEADDKEFGFKFEDFIQTVDADYVDKTVNIANQLMGKKPAAKGKQPAASSQKPAASSQQPETSGQ